MDSAIVSGLIVGISGAAVAGGFTVFNLWLNRRSEERRQIRELAVKPATENWKAMSEVCKDKGADHQPIDVYLIHAMHLVSALDGRLKTPAAIRDHMRRTFEATQAALQETKAYNDRRT